MPLKGHRRRTWRTKVTANVQVKPEILAEVTKTSEPRVVFLCGGAYDILKAAGRVPSPDHHRVCTFRGKPLKRIKQAFTHACRKAGTTAGFMICARHTFNMKEVDHPVIMKLTGPKTPAVQRRGRQRRQACLSPVGGASQPGAGPGCGPDAKVLPAREGLEL